MSENHNFDIGNFITDSLCLHANIGSERRVSSTNQFKSGLKRYFKENPLDVLGEKTFVKTVKTPYNVTGTDLQEFYRDAKILITGGTGFLGKLLTEKLVRSVPHLGHIYLLIRPKRGNDPHERLEKLLKDKVFRRMREEVPWYHSKVTAVAGDLHEPGLGLSAEDRQLLTDQVHVVFHSAANVKFTQTLKTAIKGNVAGTQRVMDLTSEMTRLKACVYVSTAFSQCVRRVIPETVPRMNIPYKDILTSIDTHGDDPQDPEIIRLMQGWPNTYTFSKALCEIMLDEEYQTLPLSIIRPSVIVPTYEEPVRGWADNLYGPMALMVAGAFGVVHTYLIDEELSLDMVPADYVVNAMISTARATGTKRRSDDIKVYNFTTQSPQRPFSWKQILLIAGETVACWPFNKALWYVSQQTHTSRTLYEIKHFLLHKIPAWIGDKVLYIMGKQPRLMKACNTVDELFPALQYIINGCFEFKNDNIQSLWRSLGEDDKSLFNFDTSQFNMLHAVIKSTLGIKYYFFHDDLDSLPQARRRNGFLYWIHNSVKTVFWFGVLTVAVRVARVVPL